MDGRMFQKLIPRLARTARAIAYDLRGHGLARGAPLTQSLDHLVADLVLLFDKLGIGQANVYGASFGGAVVQYFTLAHPDHVRSLCPIATSAQGHPILHSRATRAENGEMSHPPHRGDHPLVRSRDYCQQGLVRPLRPRKSRARPRGRVGCGVEGDGQTGLSASHSRN
jgi:pimeloyl-ACP methyl ester carboxylesterase